MPSAKSSRRAGSRIGVDTLTRLPDRGRQAVEVAERHLGSAPEPETVDDGKAPRRIKAVK